MKKRIKINDSIAIDTSVLIESKLAVLANSGGGKSWAIRRIIEQAFGQVQIVIIDPESEYGNLRKKFDFVLAGEGGETIAKPHIAAKLAEKLMELKASAIIDLYDLLPQDRKRFVRLFLDSLMNLPKHMQTDMLLIIDEAHVFAPEGKPSESTTSMEALASQGRKRNIGAIFATQRISKMSKDVLAECNNKMIGRMNLDIDRKRAGEELGYTSKEQILSLRNLKPGEFNFFGPAISDEIITGKVGDVEILPPKRGAHMKDVPSPTANVKKMIAQLSDLPQEAEKEIKTVSELQNKVRVLKRELKGRISLKPEVVFDAQAVTNAVTKVHKEMNKKMHDLNQAWLKKHRTWVESLNDFPKFITVPEGFFNDFDYVKKPSPAKIINSPKPNPTPIVEDTISKEMGNGEKVILNAIAQYPEGMTMDHLAVLTGYKSTSRTVYTQQLAKKGYIQKTSSGLLITSSGIEILGSDYKPLPEGAELREHLLKTLPEGERKVFAAILNSYTSDGVTKEQIMNDTGYKSTSVTVYVQRLAARKVITNDRGVIKVSEKLL